MKRSEIVKRGNKKMDGIEQQLMEMKEIVAAGEREMTPIASWQLMHENLLQQRFHLLIGFE